MRLFIHYLTLFCFLNLAACEKNSDDVSKNVTEPLKYSEGVYIDSRDGQVYKTSTIGTQTWFAQNLNFKTTNSSCYLKKRNFCDEYGRLYTWTSAIDSVCPDGWRLPSKNDYETLFNAIDRFFNANKSPLEIHIGVGKILKAQTGWLDPSIKNSDNFSFAVLPAGDMHDNGHFMNRRERANFWTSTEINENDVYRVSFSYANDEAKFAYGEKNYGFSIRCIKN